MKPARARAFMFVTVAVAMLGVPAIAASADAPAGPLAPGSHLYGLVCASDPIPNGQLFSLDAATGEATAIGTGSDVVGNPTGGISQCAGQPAWDARTSTAYYVARGPGSFSALATVDLVTGQSHAVALFSGDTNIAAIAINPAGVAYALDLDSNLFTLDLATAQLGTPLQLENGLVVLRSLTADPRTGRFYALSDRGMVFPIDLTSNTPGLLAEVGYIPTNVGDPFPDTSTLQIDTNGTVIIQNYVDGVTTIVSAQLGDFSNTLSTNSQIVYNSSYPNVAAFLIVQGVAPTITSTSPPVQLTIDTWATFPVSATGSGIITFSVVGTLPTGLSVNSTTGLISGTPVAAGTFTYRLIATNETGAAEATYTQTVGSPPAVSPPVISVPVVSG